MEIKPGVALIILLMILLFADRCYADEFYPFYVANQNPFIQIFGLPRADTAKLLSDGESQQFTALDVVNNTVQGSDAHDTVVLDGETYRLNLGYKFSVKDIEYSVDIPLISHTSGYFDNAIRHWHSLLGISNDEQKQFPANHLKYLYTHNGKTLINIDRNTSGIGDIQIGIASRVSKRQLKQLSSLAFRTTIKLPSGNSGYLMGSGAPDIAFAISSQADHLQSIPGAGLYGDLGILWLGRAKQFSETQRRLVEFGTVGFSWKIVNNVVFHSQLDMHTSFYNSQIVDIGGNSVQLTVGGAYIGQMNNRFDVGITENMLTDATPDFGINFVYRYNYKN